MRSETETLHDLVRELADRIVEEVRDLVREDLNRRAAATGTGAPVQPESAALPIQRDRVTLSIAEVIEATGLSTSTLYRHLKSGELRSVLIGGRRLVRVSDLHQFVAAHLDAPAAVKP